MNIHIVTQGRYSDTRIIGVVDDEHLEYAMELERRFKEVEISTCGLNDIPHIRADQDVYCVSNFGRENEVHKDSDLDNDSWVINPTRFAVKVIASSEEEAIQLAMAIVQKGPTHE